ncbi:hypothetical protein AAKU55_005335 [Oxalobacteraceae bacterium GrIS 1.11]
MKLYQFAGALIAAAVLTGCAHPVMIVPNMAKIERSADAPPRIKSKVGYYINEASRTQVVTTPGGGGDKVTSMPYRDLESGLYMMLTNVFDGVTRLKTPDDKEAINNNQIAYIITPEIVPSSSSSSALTWPPTHFDIDLTCKITDASGKPVDSIKVTGKGDAEFSEFKMDHGLSGKRAAEDALQRMQRKLLELKLTPGATVSQ